VIAIVFIICCTVASLVWTITWGVTSYNRMLLENGCRPQMVSYTTTTTRVDWVKDQPRQVEAAPLTSKQ
jgi:hypothetical protein